MPSIRIGDKWNVDPKELLLRPYEDTDADLAALTQVRNETLRATTLPEDFNEVAPEEMRDYYARGDYSLAGNAWLMLHGSEPIAAALVYPMAAFHDRPPGNFHLYVVPRFWSHGIGSRLLAHLEQAALKRSHPVLETTVAREDDQSCGFLVNHSFHVVGHSVHLTRGDMSDLPSLELSPDYTITSVGELGEPYSFYAETANRLAAYDPHYSLMAQDDASGGDSGDWDPAGALILFDPDMRVVGAIRASKTADTRGHLNEVRLEPASRGKGLGTALVAAALRYLAETGVQRVELDTPAENVAARTLARRAGFEETRHWLRFLKRLAG